MGDILKEAIAEAKYVRQVAYENAKAQLTEAFNPRIQNALSNIIQSESENSDMEDETGEEETEDEENLEETEDPGKSEGPETKDDQDVTPDLSETEDPGKSEGPETKDDQDVTPDLTENDDYDEDDEDETDMEIESILDELDSETEDEDDIEDNEPDLDDDTPDSDSSIDVTPDDEPIDNGDENIDDEDEDDVTEQAQDMDVDGVQDDDEDEDVNIEELLTSIDEDNWPGEENSEYKDKEQQNVVKKLESVRSENRVLKKKLNKYDETVKFLKKQLSEVNLLNTKLLYTTKLFKNFKLTNEVKTRIVEQFDRTKSVREVKLIYSTLHESFKTKNSISKKTLKESMIGGASKRAHGTKPSSEKTVLSEGKDFADRMKKLAGII